MSIVLEFLRILTPAQSVAISHDAYARAIRAELAAAPASAGDDDAQREDDRSRGATATADPTGAALARLLGGPAALAAIVAVAVGDALDRHRGARTLDEAAATAIDEHVRRHVYQALVAHAVMLAGEDPRRRSAADAYWQDLVERADGDDDEHDYDAALARAAADGCRAALRDRGGDHEAILASADVGARRAIAQWRDALGGADGQAYWDLQWQMARVPARCQPPAVESAFALFIGRRQPAIA